MQLMRWQSLLMGKSPKKKRGRSPARNETQNARRAAEPEQSQPPKPETPPPQTKRSQKPAQPPTQQQSQSKETPTPAPQPPEESSEKPPNRAQRNDSSHKTQTTPPARTNAPKQRQTNAPGRPRTRRRAREPQRRHRSQRTNTRKRNKRHSRNAQTSARTTQPLSQADGRLSRAAGRDRHFLRTQPIPPPLAKPWTERSDPTGLPGTLPNPVCVRRGSQRGSSPLINLKRPRRTISRPPRNEENGAPGRSQLAGFVSTRTVVESARAFVGQPKR